MPDNGKVLAQNCARTSGSGMRGAFRPLTNGFRLECTASKHTPSEAVLKMLILRGAPALSAFRHSKLLWQLSQRVQLSVACMLSFAHFAEVSGVLTVPTNSRYWPPSEIRPERSGAGANRSSVPGVPRFGTISPWSSKASDIARNCGLAKIQRLERGMAYYVSGELNAAEAQLVADLLHHRMTDGAG